MLTAREIRESFKQFFASRGHQIVPSAPVVVKGNPMLMLTNAGMNQFKDIILGNVPRKYPRVADSQKCLRVSGKHNDLEEAGHDTYHHMMFGILGDWSFRGYFRRGAINQAWEYLVKVLKLNPKRLYTTVFEGNPAKGLDRDNEAASYWEQYLPKSHVLNGNKHDNFWEMRDTGPCDPCSGIHIDLRSDEERAAVSGTDMINKNHPQVIEIWNLVFMQFSRKADGSLESLPVKVIDTGMGFEYLCMALQGRTLNYDTDVFRPIIEVTVGMAGTTYGTDKQQGIAVRTIADHTRTIAFAITDGQLPSNAKAGYVIHRILQRAVRYGYTFLDRKEAFMYKLLPVLTEMMGDAYSELIAQKTLTEKVIKEEEESFLRTLETDIRLLDKKMEETKTAGRTVLNDVDAFILYDTYGFLLDLTELILRENGMEVDVEEFGKAMQKQKERARNAAIIETGDQVTLKDGECKFVGYDLFECEAEILRYRQIRQKNKVLYQIILGQTPFYTEMGRQVGDTGWLIADDEKIGVIDTGREDDLPVHLVTRLSEDIAAALTTKINVGRRIQCECNHSAMYLLHETLREVLGTRIKRKGSYVLPDSLRFDFFHFQKVTGRGVRKVEILVGEKIRANFLLEEHHSIPIVGAKALGAMALLGERYDDEVRVVKYGGSVELCDGTHTPTTGVTGSLRVIGESSITAGIRRIEVVTTEGAEQFVYAQQGLIRELHALMSHMPNLVQTMKKSIEEDTGVKKQIKDYIRKKSTRLKEEVVTRASENNGIKVTQFVGKANTGAMKNVAFQIKAETTDSFVFVAGIINDNKYTLMLMLNDDLMKEGLHTGKIVKEAAKHIQGGDGGQPHFATAGGKNMGSLSIAVGAVKEAVGVQ